MSEHSADDIAREVKIYITVFVSLLALTIITVAVSYLELPTAGAVLVAMLIATIKGSLVACFFMHLISEKKLIYSVLILTVLFFIGLMTVPVLDIASNAGNGS